MIFNSITFGLFLPLVFMLFWLIPGEKIRARNALLLIANYVFYGWWSWQFLGLIIISSITDFIIGKQIHKYQAQHTRKILLFTSVFINLGILAYFKYFNFFIDSFHQAFEQVGINLQVSTLRIILPVGISFYTFQSLSYTMDIYYRRLKPEKDMLVFFGFVSFFPQLVAGPIERAKNLLPQFRQVKRFDPLLAKDGLKQILWGLIKKVAIADAISPYVDYIFNHYDQLSGSMLVLGVFYFAFQIYCDFSGYSDIAVGTAKLFGYRLMTNFSYPYFSRNIGEFWRRWHISLSTWFRDYVYIPLGGNKKGKGRQAFNSLLTFTLSGLWHGASWSFAGWGFLHGVLYLPSIFSKKKRSNEIVPGKILPSLKNLFLIILTNILMLFTWVFFRSSSFNMALDYISRIFDKSLLTPPDHKMRYLPLIFIFIAIEWFNRHQEHPYIFNRAGGVVRWFIYILSAIIVLGSFTSSQNFIYFQF